MEKNPVGRASRVSAIVKTALAKNLLNDESPVLDLYDLEGLRGRFKEVQGRTLIAKIR